MDESFQQWRVAAIDTHRSDNLTQFLPQNVTLGTKLDLLTEKDPQNPLQEREVKYLNQRPNQTKVRLSSIYQNDWKIKSLSSFLFIYSFFKIQNKLQDCKQFLIFPLLNKQTKKS